MYVTVCFHYTNLCECVFVHTLDISEKTHDGVDMVDDTEGLPRKSGKRNTFREMTCFFQYTDLKLLKFLPLMCRFLE